MVAPQKKDMLMAVIGSLRIIRIDRVLLVFVVEMVLTGQMRRAGDGFLNGGGI